MREKFIFGILVFLLTGCAPIIRFQLDRTIESLPLPLNDTTLLGTYRFGSGGSDCAAYTQHNVYGSSLPMRTIVTHHEVELKNQDWEQQYEYQPNGTALIGFKRGKNEFLEMFTEDAFSVDVAMSLVPSKKLAEFDTVYVLAVTRTCRY